MFISANNTDWLVAFNCLYLSYEYTCCFLWFLVLLLKKDQCCLFLPAGPALRIAWFPAHLGTFGDEPFIPAILKFLNDLAFCPFHCSGYLVGLSVWIFLYF